MSLKERNETTVRKIVPPFNHISISVIAIIERDGIEISRTPPNYSCIAPGDNYSEQPLKIQETCKIWHTPEIKKAYAEHLLANSVSAN